MTPLLNVNEMKLCVFGLKIQQQNTSKIFENVFRNEGVAIYLCNLGSYLILLNILYKNTSHNKMSFIEMNQQNEE